VNQLREIKLTFFLTHFGFSCSFAKAASALLYPLMIPFYQSKKAVNLKN
jgi:hypothetical protein